MKLWERVVEARLREERKHTTGWREEFWYCMRKSGVAEKNVRVVQDMQEDSVTAVTCAVGTTDWFKVEVGLHQGLALSPFLFAVVMDRLMDEVRQDSPWTMMFADDIVICGESREQVKKSLERWRYMLERRGMKVSRSKTEKMCLNEREGNGVVRLQGEEVEKVEEFRYLGSTVQCNGECVREVKKRVQAEWNGWRRVTGVICDSRVCARLKGKVYRSWCGVVRLVMLYGLETVALSKRQEAELEVAELKMLRFSLGVTRMDKIRNEFIRGTAHVGCCGDKMREVRLIWFGHVQRSDMSYIGWRMLRMEPPGRRKRERPRRRFMDVVREDMQLGGAAILIIGGLIEVTKKHIFGVLDNNTIIPEELALLTKASYLMIAVGGVIAFMGFLGCCGACCENKCLLKIVIAAVLLLLDRPGAENFLEKISNKVAKSIKDTYGQNDIITRAWNETMTLMKCCGYNNYTDFQGTTFETQTSLYPNFCCSDEQSLPCDLKKAETASVNGCFKAVVNWVTSKATLLGGVAICVAAIQKSVVVLQGM
ncbi:hypothetical protein C0J45_20026 [Silurus meridionalis]|nr:hypothetical protein C0J45_20026 [Silurus meridionalis]